jgi:HSP20 family protein
MRKRRHPSIFDIFESFMKGWPFEEEERGERWFRDPFEDLIKKFEETMPEEYKNLVTEEETPVGKTKRYGPFVYGFSYTAEPGKEPVFREFGNIKPQHGVIQPSMGREPLVDVMEDEKGYKIFAELPGVEKDNIKLDATENAVTIEATGDKKFHKRIDLESAVDPDSSKASYKNGVLSVELEKREKPKKGKEIKIE